MLNSPDSARLRRCRRLAGIALATALALTLPTHASALTVADTSPIAFLPDGGGLGLWSAGQPDGWDIATSGLGVAYTYDHTDLQLSAGNPVSFPGVDLAISQSLFAVHQNPQDALNPVPSIATPANPFIADSSWTVANTTAAALDGVVLAFVIPDYASYPNAVQVALDGNLVQIIEYTTGGGSTLYLGAAHLGDLAAAGSPGDSAVIVVRYIISGELQEQVSGSHIDYIMPPLMLTAFTGGEPVPEPGAVLLYAAGLALIATRVRRRARGAPRGADETGRPREATS